MNSRKKFLFYSVLFLGLAYYSINVSIKRKFIKDVRLLITPKMWAHKISVKVGNILIKNSLSQERFCYQSNSFPIVVQYWQ